MDNPPVLEGQTSSEIIVNHLNAKHAALAAFIESETSENFRTTIRGKMRTTLSLIYESGGI